MSKTLEELEYEKRENKYYATFCRFGEEIAFDKLRKEFSGETFTPSGEFTKKHFTMEELKAIYKYCEDNKWI